MELNAQYPTGQASFHTIREAAGQLLTKPNICVCYPFLPFSVFNPPTPCYCHCFRAISLLHSFSKLFSAYLPIYLRVISCFWRHRWLALRYHPSLSLHPQSLSTCLSCWVPPSFCRHVLPRANRLAMANGLGSTDHLILMLGTTWWP